MGCEWKSADGKYCRFCVAYEYGKIDELEAYVGERCNDHFTTCPIAYAFCPPEEWDEGANGSDNDRKSNYESAGLNNYQSPLTFDSDDEDPDYFGSCHGGDRGGSVFSFGLKSSFSDFIGGFTGGGFLIGLVKAAGLITLMVISIAGVMHFVKQLGLPDDLFYSFLECAVIAGIPTLFVTAFICTGWKALAVPITYGAISLMIILSCGTGSSMESAVNIFGGVFSIIAVAAGAAPGAATLLLVILFGDKFDFQGAYLVVVAAAALISAVIFGSLYSKLLSKHTR